jgi:hypothetical protein
LTPTIDHLFDRGFIGFEGDGKLIVSPVAHRPSLERMGIETDGMNVGAFTAGPRAFLEFQRENVLLKVDIASLGVRIESLWKGPNRPELPTRRLQRVYFRCRTWRGGIWDGKNCLSITSKISSDTCET